MYLASMLMRSILSYVVFLTSRKIVKTTIGLGETLRKNFKLHRCTNCWRLYSGELDLCEFCNGKIVPLYQVYTDFQEQEVEKREGIDKFIYKGTAGLQYKPLVIK